jgi:hypothetical protein
VVSSYASGCGYKYHIYYLSPCDAEYVLETDQCPQVGPHLTEGRDKFQNGFVVVGRDGCIYCCPPRASGVLRIIIPQEVKRCDKNGSPLPDDEEEVEVMYCENDMVGCNDKINGREESSKEGPYRRSSNLTKDNSNT